VDLKETRVLLGILLLILQGFKGGTILLNNTGKVRLIDSLKVLKNKLQI